MLSNNEKIKLLNRSCDLDIDITLYRQAVNVLDFNSEDLDAFIQDVSNPVNYDFIEDQYPDDLNSKLHWTFDLQDANLTGEDSSTILTAKNAGEFWEQLSRAVEIKEKEERETKQFHAFFERSKSYKMQ